MAASFFVRCLHAAAQHHLRGRVQPLLWCGAIKGTPHKWLNLQRLFELLRQDDDIQAIRYFTALMNGSKAQRQQTYLRALATCPKVEVILGRFKEKRIACGVRGCTYPGPRFFNKPEEKRTDVGIAVALLDDAYRDLADRFVLVTGDSDLVPAVSMVKTRFPHKQIVVYVPSRNLTRGAAVELRSAADKDRDLPLVLLPRCQFPASLPDGVGGLIHKPAEW